MNLGRLTRWRRSLLAQTTALTMIFLAFAFIYVAIVPYLKYLDANDPVDRTRNLVGREIVSAAYGADAQAIDRLVDSDVLAKVAAVNPAFRYYVRRGEHSVQFGAAPKWRGAIDFNHPELESFFETVKPEDCTTSGFWSGRFDDDGVVTRVHYRECNGERSYVEYAGVAHPAALDESIFRVDRLLFFWDSSKELFAAALVFVLIAGFVLLLATKSLRRVARVAESIEAGRRGRQLLPEAGIPTEVLPLVRAINQMVLRLHENQEQQHFFLAAAAHEMRTPMTILRTRLEELPDSSVKRELRDDMRRMATLVDQLLRLMSIQGRDGLPDEVDLVEVARAVVADRAPLAIEREVEVELQAEVEQHVVKGDENLLHVALANLVDNAVSFSKAGDTVLIRVDRAGVVSVQDQGPGVVAAEAELIFEPFAKRPPNRKGHGLGLAIVKAVMSLHGGKVSIDNAAGGGARFALQL